jgi:hypothetical protein
MSEQSTYGTLRSSRIVGTRVDDRDRTVERLLAMVTIGTAEQRRWNTRRHRGTM